MSNTGEGFNEHDSDYFVGDLLDSPDRHVRLEPLYIKDDKGRPVLTQAPNGAMCPELKGFGYHMHSKKVIIDENGAHEEWQCDYVVLDKNQLVAMMDIFNRSLHIGED